MIYKLHNNIKFSFSLLTQGLRRADSNKKRGFTLVELLLFTGIFSILLLMISNLFVSTLDAKKESQSYSSVQQDSTYILNRMIHDISQADSVTTPAEPGGQTTTLSFVKDSVNYTYSINMSKIVLTIDDEAHELNGYDTNASNLMFRRLGKTNGKNSFNVSFTLVSNTSTGRGPDSRSFQTTIGTR